MNRAFVALVIAIQKGFSVLIAAIVNTGVWRVSTSVKVGGGSCGATNFKNPHTHGQGVSKGKALVVGASSVRVIAESDGSPLLVNTNLNRCGLGLAALEGLLLNIRTCGPMDYHGHWLM